MNKNLEKELEKLINKKVIDEEVKEMFIIQSHLNGIK